MIHEANTDAARHEVLDFFLAAFDDIDPNAVPMTVHDDLYAPLVVQFRDENSRQLLGAALTCCAQVAAGCVVMKKRGASLPPEPTRLLRPIPASSLNVSTSARYLQLGWAAAEQKPGSYSEDMCDTRIRQVLRYSCVSVTVGDTFIPKPAGASRHRKHAGHHGRHPDHLDNHQDQK